MRHQLELLAAAALLLIPGMEAAVPVEQAVAGLGEVTATEQRELQILVGVEAALRAAAEAAPPVVEEEALQAAAVVAPLVGVEVKPLSRPALPSQCRLDHR